MNAKWLRIEFLNMLHCQMCMQCVLARRITACQSNEDRENSNFGNQSSVDTDIRPSLLC